MGTIQYFKFGITMKSLEKTYFFYGLLHYAALVSLKEKIK